MNLAQTIKSIVKKIVFGSGDDTGSYDGPAFDHYEFLFGNGRDRGEITDVWFSTVGGGNDADHLESTDGRGNILDGGNGPDRLKSTAGRDELLNGGNGPDVLTSEGSRGNILDGGNGPDVIILKDGDGNLLDGGNGPDAYYVTGSDGTTITDGSGPSVAVIERSNDTLLDFGADNDTIKATAVTDSEFGLGDGFDRVTLANSGGGNTFRFGGDGTMIIDFTTSDADGPTFINPTEADRIDTGYGQVEILFRGPYRWDNVSGSVEVQVENFNPGQDLVRFDWGAQPTFVTMDNGTATAIFVGANNTSVFRATFTFDDGDVPANEGAFLGTDMWGIGFGANSPEPHFLALPYYSDRSGGEGPSLVG